MCQYFENYLGMKLNLFVSFISSCQSSLPFKIQTSEHKLFLLWHAGLFTRSDFDQNSCVCILGLGYLNNNLLILSWLWCIIAAKGLPRSYIWFHKTLKHVKHRKNIGVLHGENLNPSQPCEGPTGGRKTWRNFIRGIWFCDMLTMYFNVIDNLSNSLWNNLPNLK